MDALDESRKQVMEALKPGIHEELSLYSQSFKKKFRRLEEEYRNAARELMEMEHRPQKNAFAALAKYRRASKILIEMVNVFQIVHDDQNRELEILNGSGMERDKKRWTPVEDETLVDLASRGTESLMRIAVSLRRSPGAVTSRLTYLVGIRRVSEEIAGRITGFIDGEPVEGFFSGTLARSQNVPR